MWFDKLVTGLASQTTTGLVNNALSRGSAQEQRDWEEQMWHKQNAYNTPSAMAGRMRAAGLNPYAMIGAEPAGSAGSGVKADFIPLQDPLSVTRQLADIENIRATTGKTLSETEKLIQEASNLELAYEKGLIEKGEYEFRFNKLKEAWNESNPYKLENENKAADTELKKAQTASAQVDADNKQREFDDLHLESEQRIRSLKLSNDLNDKYSELERALDYDFKTLQGDLMAKNKAIAQTVADRAHLDREVLTNYGLDVESMDPLVHYPLRWVGAQLMAGKSKDDPELVSMMKAIRSFSSDLVKYDTLTRDPDYITDKDRLNRATELEKALINSLTKLIDVF